MTPCDAYRARMLEAEPAELRSEDGTELAEHLRSCAGCRAAAERILAAHEQLEATLRRRPAIDAAAIVARARAAADAERSGRGSAEDLTAGPGAEAEAGNARTRPTDAEPGRRQRVGNGGARRRRVWLVGGATLAASIAALLLLTRPEPPLPGVALAPRVAAPATVEAPADQNVAVIPTADPDITVLWFF